MAQRSKEGSPIRELTSHISGLSVTEPDAKAASDAQCSESSTTWKGDMFPNAADCQKKFAGKGKLKVSLSERYSAGLPDEWKNTKRTKVDLKTVMQRQNLRKFIREVGQKSTAYKELRDACQRSISPPKDSYNANKGESPYWSQCKDELLNELPKSEPKLKIIEGSFEAYSLTPPTVKVEPNKIPIDYEYILDMHVPVSGRNEGLHRLTDPSTCTGNNMQRWIFIPSYLRANCGLFNWEKSGADLRKTNRIIVVIPSQFDTYISQCGHALPILCLPQDVLGIGYARHWILKIAMRLGLEYVWMIDDSVSWFCRHPCQGKIMKNSQPHISFEEVLQEMEGIAHDCKQHLAAISPSRWRGSNNASKPFTYKPPQIAVYLNLHLIKERQIQYRPELDKMEDMVFGAECMIRGQLTMCRWNKILLCDKQKGWEHTGAGSPYSDRKPQIPQDKTTALSDSQSSTPKSSVRMRCKPKNLLPGDK
jgi:hypothetical protein